MRWSLGEINVLQRTSHTVAPSQGHSPFWWIIGMCLHGCGICSLFFCQITVWILEENMLIFQHFYGNRKEAEKGCQVKIPNQFCLLIRNRIFPVSSMFRGHRTKCFSDQYKYSFKKAVSYNLRYESESPAVLYRNHCSCRVYCCLKKPAIHSFANLWRLTTLLLTTLIFTPSFLYKCHK